MGRSGPISGKPRCRNAGQYLILVLGVGIGVTLLGVKPGLADQPLRVPGRRWLDWALMLPFAIPAYVLAFVFVGLLDFSGPVQTLLRDWFGTGLRWPRVRSTGGVVIVLVLVFYPYVYLLARTAFLAQGKGPDGSRAHAWAIAMAGVLARGLAHGATGDWRRRGAGIDGNPGGFWCGLGVQLRYLLRHLQDLVRLFQPLRSAAQLAGLLLLVVMLVLYGERRARGASRPNNERPRGKALYLRGFRRRRPVPLVWIGVRLCVCHSGAATGCLVLAARSVRPG